MNNTSRPVDGVVVSVVVVVVVILLLLFLGKRIGGSGGGTVATSLLLMMMSPMAMVKLSVLLFPFLLLLYEYYSSFAIFNCFIIAVFFSTYYHYNY